MIETKTNELKKDSFQIRITGKGVSVQKKVSEEVAGRLIAMTMGVDSAVTSKELSHAKKTDVPIKTKVSLKEYLDNSKVNIIQETIVVFGMFLMDVQGKELFTYDEVKTLFPKAHLKSPGNFSRDMSAIKLKGWITCDFKSESKLYVTDKGRKHIKTRSGAGN